MSIVVQFQPSFRTGDPRKKQDTVRVLGVLGVKPTVPCKAIIVYTLPLWLCRGGLADFVLNAFALVYIVELDDLKDLRGLVQKGTWL